MNLKIVEDLANRLIKEKFTIKISTTNQNTLSAHDLGYTFKFDHAKRRAGCCNYTDKTISLSKVIVLHNIDRMDSIEDTIRHEIAHALSHGLFGKRGANHGNYWKMVARTIGASPTRCYNDKKFAPVDSKYTLRCNNCGTTSSRHKMVKKSFACASCCRNGYDSRYKLEVIKNW